MRAEETREGWKGAESAHNSCDEHSFSFIPMMAFLPLSSSSKTFICSTSAALLNATTICECKKKILRVIGNIIIVVVVAVVVGSFLVDSIEFNGNFYSYECA